MLLLTSTSDLVRVITGGAADIEVHASWLDNAAGTITPGRTNTASITTATTTTVVGSPAASTQRNVKHLNIHNNHGSVTTTVTIDHTDGTTTEALLDVTLAPNESVVFDAVGGWTLYDANGLVKASVYPIATQTEQEAGTSLASFITPGRQHYHPSAAKFWAEFTGNSTTILVSYNMTSLTDGATQTTVTIATDFSSANWVSLYSCESSAVSAAAWRGGASFTKAAGSVIVFQVTGDATPVLGDPVRASVIGFGDHA